jgi:carbamoyltransferase
MEHWQDLAWRVQHDAEEALLKRAIWLRETTGAKNLCLAGGVALNCVANGRILREAGYDNVWIQPAAGDDGIAIGCAYYGHLALKKAPRTFVMKHAYLGAKYSPEKIEKAANELTIRIQTKTHKSDDICQEAAKLLAEGKIFGWFQGASEFGPRALGNRSIIADPRNADMRDRLNKVVKHRQAFRPFAPIALAERAPEIFDDYVESPFMLLAFNVKPEWRERIPAVVHVDGTARLQTVTEDTNPRLYRLLKEFDALTGVPVLVNTSFNVKGEPIVERPQDAINCFLGTGMDCLVLEDRLMTKTRSHRIVTPFVNAYEEVSTMVRAGLNTT